MQKNKAVIIATEGLTTNLLHESLSGQNITVTKVFIESQESKLDIIKRRVKRLGLSKTMGQVFFLLLILPFIPKRKKRIQAILTKTGLKGEAISPKTITAIHSVHDPNLAQLIIAEKPDLIFINGTRILKKAFLSQMTCPIVNIHVGITPKYRGVHGGYWAKYNDDSDLFGVTLHYVDAGIDTGNIIDQKIIATTAADNFKTYPLLQYCAGLELAAQHLSGIIENTITSPDPLTEASHLYYHPTFFSYLLGKK